MNPLRKFQLATFIILLCGILITPACDISDDSVGDNFAEAVLEAAIEQTISTHHNISASVETDGGSISFDCERSGTGSYSQEENGGKICWKSVLNGCTFVGEKGSELSLSGTSSLCYASDIVIETGVLQLADAGELEFSGSITASGTGPMGTEYSEKTCSYNATATVDVSEENGQVCTEMDLNGDITCGLRDRTSGGNIKICVSNEVEAQ